MLKFLHEPEEHPVKEVIRIIRNMRGMNITNGFNDLLHPFMAIEKEHRDNS